METIAALYEVTCKLGSGGGGIIYLGRHLRLDKKVVLKADNRPLSKGAMSSLKHEADTLKDLSHAYIPQIYDFVIEDGIVYTVMDFIEGESLDKALDRGERFTSRQIVVWAKQVLEALVYLHSRPPYGILHSDIKPANIMATPQGDIRLIDFNIALALGEAGAVSVGRSQGYASPEHYGMDYSSGSIQKQRSTSALTDHETVVSSEGQKSAALDIRSDIYGLGATLYHLLTGRRPARNAGEVDALTCEDCPSGLATIINKAMAPDRSLRFQTAADMLAAFVGIHKSDPRSRRHRLLRNAVAAVVIAILVVGSFMTFTGLRRMEADSRVEALLEASRNALMKGDRTEAVNLALEAIPTKSDLFTPTVSAGAIQALADALGVYDLSEGFKLYHTVALPSAPLMADISPDGKTAAIVYAYETAVASLESGRIDFTCPMARSALAEARFLSDTTLVCAGLDGLSAYNATTGVRIWTASPATAVAVSSDGGTVAAVNRDDDFATLYDAYGEFIAEIDFQGKRQRVANNDTFANPRDNIFSLSADGQFLAVSFSDGSLSVFDTMHPENMIDIDAESPTSYIRYEGGFSGNLLAFSATHSKGSDFAVIDMAKLEQLGSFSSTGRFGVLADENGITLSLDNLVVRLNPLTGEQKELAWVEADVAGFATSGGYTLVSLDGVSAFFDKAGRLISRYERESPTDITLISGDYALLGGRDSQNLTVFRLEQHEDALLFDFDDTSYHYLEARVSADGNRLTLFSVDGFRIYNRNGTIICEQLIPDSGRVYDQQYSKASGNLAVMYKAALLIYSGYDGELIFENTNLRSVFYANYGISILDAEGNLSLIDQDSGEAVFTETLVKGETFAAFCGRTVDSAFLAGRTMIGAAKQGGEYLFAVADGETGSVHDGTGRKLFVFPVSGQAEAFFTGTAVVVSPMHGQPVVYSLDRGRKIADIKKDAYLTYVTEMGDYIVCQYLSTDGEQFGVLLGSSFQSVATLPRLCDTLGGQLVFAYPQGVLRYSRIYTLDELLDQAPSRRSVEQIHS